MYVLIDGNNRVRQCFEADPPPVAEPLAYVETEADARPGMIWEPVEETFSWPPQLALLARTPEQVLAGLKLQLRAAVDASAEQERLKYITAGTGQALTYMRKLEEARAADSEPDPDPQDYPMLAASIGVDGATVADVADVVLARDALWSEVGAAIETVRLGAKHAIDQAADAAAAEAAFDAIAWPE